MHFHSSQLEPLLAVWLWTFMRVGGVIMTAPIIGTRAVPARIRLILVVALSVMIVPLVQAVPGGLPDAAVASFDGLVIGAQQLVVGATMGLTLRLVFAAAELAGQVIAQQMGLAFASMVDPQTGAQVPVISQFYIVAATLLFFAFDAHLALISLIVDSFTLLPIGLAGLQMAGFELILEWSRTLFSGALSMVLPVVSALLVVNLSFGVMARAAPQLNVFAVGFPVMMLFGVFAIYATFDQLEIVFAQQLEAAFTVARAVLTP